MHKPTPENSLTARLGQGHASNQRVFLQPIPVGEPFDGVRIDLLRLFPKTAHCGTRLAETKALPTGTEQEVAQHSTTCTILIDSGKILNTVVLQELLCMLDIQSTMSTGY
ncbi:hypothetical protein PR048_012695 [Dryococelus australis]|uniref:Uncharacterized protein n=1 Tax=Dryococelus australis TaxID=614101 RepID=A0ABQ9HQ33_9NEOP|nr:hypothetical protein PR048_012695 [Dryococelus australis]